MKLTGESKFFIGVFVSTILVIGLAAVFLTKPPTVVTIPKETLIPQTAHTKGNATASAYLVEFSDFQCPACRAMAPTVSLLTEKYKDDLLFVYRHFPLSQHAFAKKAAYAAEAAAKQDKFWEAEKLLFDNQDNFSDEFFSSKFPELLFLDKEQYETDMKSKDIIDLVNNDLNIAGQLNLPGTPSFFLNGVRIEVSGANDLEEKIKGAISQNP